MIQDSLVFKVIEAAGKPCQLRPSCQPTPMFPPMRLAECDLLLQYMAQPASRSQHAPFATIPQFQLDPQPVDLHFYADDEDPADDFN